MALSHAMAAVPGAAGGGGGFAPEDITGVAEAWVGVDCSAVGDGNAVTNWVGRVNGWTLTQATSGKRPLYRASGIGGAPALDFDGTDDLLRYAGTVSTADTGHVFAVVYFDSVAGGTQIPWCTADEATDENFLCGQRYATSNTAAVQATIAGSTDQVRGDTTVAVSTAYLLEWASDGADYLLRVNGTVQSNTVVGGADTGDWFGDVPGRDNFTVGGLKLNFGESNYFNGRLGELVPVDGAISGGDRTSYNAYVNSTYGITIA